MKRFKRSVCLLLMLTLTLLAATAAAQSLTANPSSIDPQRLAHREYRALIRQYNESDNTLEITLCDVESFDADAVKGLQTGDVVVSDGTEYTVQTIRFDDDGRICILNESDDEYDENMLTLTFDENTGAYAPVPEYESATWLPVTTLTVEAPDTLVLLDSVDDSNGEPLDTPVLYGKADFVKMVADYAATEEGAGFATSNVYVLFDEANLPVLVRRFYVPWQ